MILAAILSLGGIGLVLGIGLGIAQKRLAVKTDPREETIFNSLPGTNCGACGFPGCAAYAGALIKEGIEPDKCTVGGVDVSKKIGAQLGIEVKETIPQKIVVRCFGGKKETTEKFEYKGIKSCKAVNLIGGGNKGCSYGCLGFGDCFKVCPFDAIKINDNGLPEINIEKCTTCGLCAKECPRDILTFLPATGKVYVGCKSHDKGPAVKKVCKVGCIACGICVKKCPKGAFKLEDNLAVVDHEKCNASFVCVEKCPQKIIFKL